MLNKLSFAADSLFCEYAYVVDLDQRTFEVYKGYNQHPVEPEERFANMEGKDEYYPVKHLTTFSLDALPTNEEFLEITEKSDEDEEVDEAV